MTTPAPWCSSTENLTADEIRTLDEIPDGDNEVRAEVNCWIQAGHPGRHMSFGQSYGEVEWWLQWGPEGRVLGVLPNCEAEDEESGNVCLLPAGHWGRCGFGLD